MPNTYLVKINGRPCLQTDDGLFALSDAVPSFDMLLQDVAAGDVLTVLNDARAELLDADTVTFQPPLDNQEVWAAGVTYKRSEEAREEESGHRLLYTHVYNAERPEVFFKANGIDVVGNGDEAGIRYDATWSVPEPELTVVFNARHEVVGFTIGNDMSSRDIEGANPLYLPQAKVYDYSCVVGPRVWLMPNQDEWVDVTIQMTIDRDGEQVFAGETSTAQLNRTLADLRDYLGRCKHFPRGVYLMTGTGIVPPDEFTLNAGDTIRIAIEPIGVLNNQVVVVGPFDGQG